MRVEAQLTMGGGDATLSIYSDTGPFRNWARSASSPDGMMPYTARESVTDGGISGVITVSRVDVSRGVVP